MRNRLSRITKALAHSKKPALWIVGAALVWASFPLRDLLAATAMASVVLLPLSLILVFYFCW